MCKTASNTARWTMLLQSNANKTGFNSSPKEKFEFDTYVNAQRRREMSAVIYGPY